MASAEARQRRRGGRSARQAHRRAPIAEDKRPVPRGVEGGGRYGVVSDHDIKRIHHTVLDVLENIGLTDPLPSTVEYVTAGGGFISGDGRLCLPRALVEDTIARAARNFVLHGQLPKHDMDPWGGKVYYGTAGGAVSMVDPRTGAYRDSTLVDLYDSARLVDSLEHVHYFQRTLVPCDITDSLEMDFNTCYAAVSGTGKHVGTSWFTPESMSASIDMLHVISGDEGRWRKRPFVSISCCFVVPPLRFAEEACKCLEIAVNSGMPVLLVSAGQAGATSPAALAGALVQEWAEVLAGLVIVNCMVPGAPTMPAPWSFVCDLRTGAMSGGSGEEALLMSATAQMAKFYDLPATAFAGMSDSKIPDAQSGYEKGYNLALVGNSGANMVYGSAGMLASLLGYSHESVVLDNDAIGACLRTVRGIEVNDETLSYELIREVCIGGPGHYLSSGQTMSLMETEYLYPTIGDRRSPQEWAELGSRNSIDRAMEFVDQILTQHYPRHVSAEIDAQIRDRMPVRLPREFMMPHDRWPRRP